MKTYRINDVVRDGVYESMVEGGQHVATRPLDSNLFMAALFVKLVKFNRQFEREQTPDILAEKLELMDTMATEEPSLSAESYGKHFATMLIDAEVIGSNLEEVRQIQQAQRARFGTYAGKVFVEHVTVMDHHPAAAYYALSPELYPEILL
jgi:predicted house-cleaning noncanonical NTP pyrophosphatase (MazG superfamily)